MAGFPFADHVFTAVHPSTLGLFRILFGVLMVWQAFHELQTLEPSYFQSDFHFPYSGLEFIQPLSLPAMQVLCAVLIIAALFITTGIAYRWAMAVFTAGFGYLFLIDQTNYQNHYYLILLVGFLGVFLPADHWGKLHLIRRTQKSTQAIPQWSILLLRVQFCIVYFFAAVAKLTPDWLQGEPIRHWLTVDNQTSMLTSIFPVEVLTPIFTYGGLLFDLATPFLLWGRRTRYVAIVGIFVFHLTNSVLLDIGVFPWFMLATTVVFLSPESIHHLVQRLRRHASSASHHLPLSTQAPTAFSRRWTLGLIAAYLTIQIFLPVRHWLYPGDVNWTEEGHRFSWRMKLRDKMAGVVFRVIDFDNKHLRVVKPVEGITRWQSLKMAIRPQLIRDYARYLAAKYPTKSGGVPVVQAVALASLNGRAYQPLIDADIDLVRAEDPLLASALWIVPLDRHPSIGVYPPLPAKEILEQASQPPSATR